MNLKPFKSLIKVGKIPLVFANLYCFALNFQYLQNAIAMIGQIKGLTFCFTNSLGEKSETDWRRHIFERKASEKVPPMTLWSGDMKMPMLVRL